MDHICKVKNGQLIIGDKVYNIKEEKDLFKDIGDGFYRLSKLLTLLDKNRIIMNNALYENDLKTEETLERRLLCNIIVNGKYCLYGYAAGENTYYAFANMRGMSNEFTKFHTIMGRNISHCYLRKYFPHKVCIIGDEYFIYNRDHERVPKVHIRIYGEKSFPSTEKSFAEGMEKYLSLTQKLKCLNMTKGTKKLISLNCYL